MGSWCTWSALPQANAITSGKKMLRCMVSIPACMTDRELNTSFGNRNCTIVRTQGGHRKDGRTLDSVWVHY